MIETPMTASECITWGDVLKVTDRVIEADARIWATYAATYWKIFTSPQIMWLITEGDMPGIGEGQI